MNSVVVWTEPTGSIVPKTAADAPSIAGVAKTLSTRDQRQIVSAFEAESFEMMAGFVLNKALSQLKRTLAGLGMSFVGEMLGRADLDEDSVPTVTISNFESIALAKELGLINSTDAKRLTQHLELLAHFDSLNPADSETEEMTREEALSFLRTCVNSVLGKEDNATPVEFASFRSNLENRTFKEGDQEIQGLNAAPYFFRKTTLSILLSSVRTKAGAQFEHTLGNMVVIIPSMWPGLRDTERWAIGQSYAEVVSAGLAPAVLALKKALTQVQGFDYVPETLRSQTFSAAASNVIKVHTAMNNFYNEPAAINALRKLGTTIPWPAFPISMSAVLAVFLGNTYGRSFEAQPAANDILKRISRNQWSYYTNECLPADVLILQKISWSKDTRSRWFDLVEKYDIYDGNSKSVDVKKILEASTKKDHTGAQKAAEKLLSST